MNSHGTILIVEDEPALRRFMTQLLMREGYDVDVAEDGFQALSLVEEKTPDLVLLDLMLPGMDGFDVCRRLRARKETAQVPIVVVTARGTQDSQERSFEAGANDFILKPYDPRELIALVEQRIRENPRSG
jgi:two-component system phosphate regulon response regulator PhoB